MQYTIYANPRARRLIIRVRHDGSVRVTKPRSVSARVAQRFVEKNVNWILRAKRRVAMLPKTTRIETSANEYRRFKKAALGLVERRTRHFNVHYSLRYRKVFVRNQKSRWGSCSLAGNLSFNYRLIFLPPALADYVIVHELCHLREMNHSRAFWWLVAEAIPDYAACRKELRKWGHTLLIH